MLTVPRVRPVSFYQSVPWRFIICSINPPLQDGKSQLYFPYARIGGSLGSLGGGELPQVQLVIKHH
jgi:hypothetical protein